MHNSWERQLRETLQQQQFKLNYSFAGYKDLKRNPAFQNKTQYINNSQIQNQSFANQPFKVISKTINNASRNENLKSFVYEKVNFANNEDLEESKEEQTTLQIKVLLPHPYKNFLIKDVRLHIDQKLFNLLDFIKSKVFELEPRLQSEAIQVEFY